MKRLTYHNLLRAIKILQAKGYSFEESEQIAKQKFEYLEQDRTGFWTFEKLADQIVTKDEYEQMLAQA